MPNRTRDEIRRWVVDQFAKEDPLIRHRPKKEIQETIKTLQRSSPEERQVAVQQLWTYAHNYYENRHNEAIPTEIAAEIQKVNKRAERMTVIDQSRAFLEKHGLPPTTRSLDERAARGVSPFERSAEAKGFHPAGQELERVRPREKEAKQEKSAEMAQGMGA